MNPTNILVEEHRVIEQVLSAFDKILIQAIATRKLDAAAARDALDFLHGFADRCHHAKEEAHLFPIMEARGFSGGCSPVTVVQREHELGRLYVEGMLGALDAASKGDPEALQWFTQHGQSYVRMLREHIQKEEFCLFPSANRAFREEDVRDLLEAFEKLESAEQQDGSRERYLALANQLADRFGVARASVAEGVHGCGCGQ